MARFPDLPMGSRRTYNSNMAAVDDAVGVLRSALAGNSATFGNSTLVVFTQDNGGPAQIANNRTFHAVWLNFTRRVPHPDQSILKIKPQT